MAMSQDEFSRNIKVQNLKPDLDEAEAAANDPVKMAKLSGKRLSELIESVDKSVRSRSSLSSLGSDTGHAQRIQKEQRILVALRDEAARRKDVDSQKINKKNAEAMANSNLTFKPGPAWGGKK